MMKRAWFATLAVVILAAGGACKSKRPQPSAAAPASGAATARKPLPAPPPSTAKPSTSTPHAIDPHSLSEAELRFGVSPTRSDAVTYQDNVVLMEQGAKAIRSVSPDGLTWTFDANAPQVREIETGKVVFATSRAVGRVLGVRHSGSDVSVVFGPVEITDVIKEADLSYHQPLDLQSMVAYTAPNYPGTSSDLGKVTADAGRGDGTSITAIVLSSAGDITPVSFVSRPAPSGLTPDAWTDADSALIRDMQEPATGGIQIPTAPKALGAVVEVPGIGPPSQTDIQDFHVVPFCCGGLGIKLLHDGADIKFQAYVVLRLNKPTLDFELKINKNGIQAAKVVLNGAAGLTVHLEAATTKGLSGNVNKTFYVPVDLSVPIAGMGVPFAVTLHQQFLVRTAFTAKNSTLSSTGDYTFSGTIFMGLDNGHWGVGAPTALHINSSLGQSLSGVSLGATGMVFGMEGRVIVGIGAFGFVTGPYLGYSAVAGLTRGSDLTTGLVGVTCRGSELALSINAGVGYQIPKSVKDAINFLLGALHIAPIQSLGGLQHNESLWRNASDNPKGCAGYK